MNPQGIYVFFRVGILIDFQELGFKNLLIGTVTASSSCCLSLRLSIDDFFSAISLSLDYSLALQRLSELQMNMIVTQRNESISCTRNVCSLSSTQDGRLSEVQLKVWRLLSGLQTPDEKRLLPTFPGWRKFSCWYRFSDC